MRCNAILSTSRGSPARSGMRSSSMRANGVAESSAWQLRWRAATSTGGLSRSWRPPARFVRPPDRTGDCRRRGEIRIDSPRQTTVWLFLVLVRDRKGDLVLLDAGVEDLVVEERGRLRLEKYSSSLLLDHLVVLGRQRNDAELEVRLRPRPFGDQPQTARLGSLVGRRNDVLHGLNRVVGECEQRAHLLPGWFRSEASSRLAACRGQCGTDAFWDRTMRGRYVM